MDYRELPDTYVIFITEKDYYKAGKPVYVIQNINLTLGLKMELIFCMSMASTVAILTLEN